MKYEQPLMLMADGIAAGDSNYMMTMVNQNEKKNSTSDAL